MEITGKLLYFDRKNRNGRVYTQKCALDIMQQFGELAHNGTTMLGEFGYPENRAEVALANVSHRIKSLHLDVDNKCIEGTIEILEGTPNGQKVLRALGWTTAKFEDLFVVRPRGTGTVNENGEVENYKLYSFDIISKDIDAFKEKEGLKI